MGKSSVGVHSSKDPSRRPPFETAATRPPQGEVFVGVASTPPLTLACHLLSVAVERNWAGRHEHTRRAASSDDLQVRPAGGARSASRAPAPGAAFPHGDPVLLA